MTPDTFDIVWFVAWAIAAIAIGWVATREIGRAHGSRSAVRLLATLFIALNVLPFVLVVLYFYGILVIYREGT